MKKLFIPILIITTLCGSLSLFAATNARRIRASLDPNYAYTLNNKAILDKEPTIVYKGRAYVPVDMLANALGYNVNIKNNQIAITTPSATKPTPKPEPEPAQNVTIPKAEILAINFANDTITVLPAGKPNELVNQIVLKITDETAITDGKTKRIYTINDLTPCIPVKVVHSPAMTFSIPPQTVALSITLL